VVNDYELFSTQNNYRLCFCQVQSSTNFETIPLKVGDAYTPVDPLVGDRSVGAAGAPGEGGGCSPGDGIDDTPPEPMTT
jgi:hypothetical protein